MSSKIFVVFLVIGLSLVKAAPQTTPLSSTTTIDVTKATATKPHAFALTIFATPGGGYSPLYEKPIGAAGGIINANGPVATQCPRSSTFDGRCPDAPQVTFNTTLPDPQGCEECGDEVWYPDGSFGNVFMVSIALSTSAFSLLKRYVQDVEVPGGQQLYAQFDGLVRYTTPGGSVPPGSYKDLWNLTPGSPGPPQDNFFLRFNHTFPYFCAQTNDTTNGLSFLYVKTPLSHLANCMQYNIWGNHGGPPILSHGGYAAYQYD